VYGHPSGRCGVVVPIGLRMTTKPLRSKSATRRSATAQPMAFRRHGLGNRPQRLPLSPRSDDLANSLLLGRDLDQLADVAATESERRG
jgi:hypothetical protein